MTPFPPSSRRTDAGFTRIDLVVSLTLISVLILTLVPLFVGNRFGGAPADVRALLYSGAEKTLEGLEKDLSVSARMFHREDGLVFLARLDLSSAPVALAGTRLPAVRADGVLPPPAPAPEAGNSLFFAGLDRSENLPDVMGGNGVPVPISMDVLVLRCYYLSPVDGRTIGGRPVLNLWEWDSAPYADFRKLAGMTDVTLRNSAIEALVGKGVALALDPAAPSPEKAFYQLSLSAPWISALPDHRPPQGKLSNTTDAMTKATADGLICSVSPNTGGEFVHKYPVPSHAAAEKEFPAGFETFLAGPPGARRVMVRLVTAATGDFNGAVSQERLLLAAVRDNP